MKGLTSILSTLLLTLVLSSANGQFAAVKSFDYSILEDKVLYIPTYELSQKFVKKKGKKGKYDDIADAQAGVDAYNAAWNEAMAESSYDATDYEIRGYDSKQLIKSKDPKAILLTYRTDDYGNLTASMLVTGPKKKVIASAPVTGLDFDDKADIRLMVNMLNESLNTAAEVNEEEGSASRSGVRNKYKQAVVDWYENKDDKIFLVPAVTHKNEKKEAQRNADLQDALKLWTLSEAKFSNQEEVNKLRLEGDPDHYFWTAIPIYTNNPLITYNYNIICSTDGDDIIAVFMGKGKMKPSAIKQIQSKITAKAERYKRQLAD